MIQELSDNDVQCGGIVGGDLSCGVWASNTKNCTIIDVSCPSGWIPTIFGWIDCGLSTKNATLRCGSDPGYEIQENAIVTCYFPLDSPINAAFCSEGDGQGHYCVWCSNS
jgi:hypothetical protein